MAALNSFSYICTRALHSFLSFAHCRAASTVIPLLPKAIFTPTIQPITSVYLVPVIHLLPPSTPFWPYDTQPFFPHAQTISILTGPLHSLTLFLFQLSSTLITLSIRDTLTRIVRRTSCIYGVVKRTSRIYNIVGRTSCIYGLVSRTSRIYGIVKRIHFYMRYSEKNQSYIW